MIVQVYGVGGHQFVKQSELILRSIRCHGNDLQWRTWGLYDLLAEAPSDFELASQKVMNIYLQLLFRRGRSNDMLTIEQWSLANVQLKGVYLDEWFERKRDDTVHGIEIDNYESLPKIYGQVSIFKSGVFTIISTPDFLIKWDEATRIYLTVYSQHRGNMEGLCGNYNDDNADDIKTAQGITGSITEYEKKIL